MALKILSLEVKDSRTNFNKKYSFNDEVMVKQSEAVFILQNLLNFVSIPYANTFESTTELQVNEDNLRITKNYATSEISYFINNEEQDIKIYEWLSEKLGLEITPPIWESRLIDFKNLNIETQEDLLKIFKQKDEALQLSASVFDERDSLNAKFEKLKSESLKGLTEEQIQKIDRMRELKSRIARIQKEVDSYQTQKEDNENLEKKVREKELEVNTLKDKLESVASLIKSKDQIVSQLSKYNSVENNINSLREEKSNKTHQFLQNAYTKPEHKSINDDEKNEHLPLGKILLIIQIPATLVLVIVGYLLIKQEFLLLLGFIVILLEFAFIIFEVFHKPQENLNILRAETPQITQSLKDLEQSDDNIFVNQAWRGAYEHELTKIDQLITSNLSDKNYDEVENEKNIKQIELSDLRQRLSELKAKSLDSESYYKKRRELDILKIEKENLEFGTSIQIPNESEIESLGNKLEDLEDSIESIAEAREQIPFIAINVSDKLKNIVKGIAGLRQIVLINSNKQ